MEYDNPKYVKFVTDMTKAGVPVDDYNGRDRYHGPAVKAGDYAEMQSLIRKTTVKVQWDELGKHGYILYPVP